MNKHGQSIIEYALIAVLVILGIVFMGPYVLRSVNAHFKLWDTGVQDSFKENLTQAPVNDVPPINTNCHCTDSRGSCGTNGNVIQCSASQREIDHNCNIQYCDGEPLASCVNDPTCCTTPTFAGCGSIPLGQTLPTPLTGCYYGYDIMEDQCGTNTAVTCVKDNGATGHGCYAPTCSGIASPGSCYCQGSSSTYCDTTMPTVDQPYTTIYVNSLTACSTTNPCEMFCNGNESYFLNTTGTGCSDYYTICYPPPGNLSNWEVDSTVCSPDSMCSSNPNAIITNVLQSPATLCSAAHDSSPAYGQQCTLTITYR